jgi:GR25 family glycosyltransferase involved in LPS biosynthesis
MNQQNNNFIIKVISRISSNRREMIEKKLKDKNIPFSFFDAADKSNIRREDKIFNYNNLILELNTNMPFPDAFSNRKWMKIGEVGCFFSHYALWVELVNSGKDAYFILEDDADPMFKGEDVKKLLNENSLNGVDLILCQSISPNFPRGKKLFNNLSEKLDLRLQTKTFDWETTEGTTGYIVTSSGAKKLIKLVETYQMFNPIDNFIGRCITTGLDTFLCPRYLQVGLNENVQTEIHYDISEENVQYIENIKFMVG